MILFAGLKRDAYEVSDIYDSSEIVFLLKLSYLLRLGKRYWAREISSYPRMFQSLI